ncbi:MULTISPECIES: TonB-dependent receptor [Alteromonadaceae]|uniref:TonB-dependent receptor n=1 Tax=Alteromonadaceae TaxID=72275 RepID=UPI001C08614A|nr:MULTISPECIES: TonB-dependent receptor [Aliiglaciecola]MBU2880139.1 TonB-dependent receptor [Aliiglaciecola lipolytica]MDO6710865.1 TonB-dependent receptor [Aliiglaciecola sp. 2_MG-2023]MDO6752346.1 TonB-dependent receptor [Aliiglaciecola sp. 1_MG-2023]
MSLNCKLNKITRSIFNARLPVSLAVVSAIAITPVHAQEDETAADNKSGIGAMMEKIQVTARKREESLQEAPLSLTAFSGDGLEARGIENVSEIGGVTPNLTYQNSPGAGGSSSVATVYIRGVGQRDFLGTIDNGVGFYVDGVYIARTVGATVDLLDVDRVEVLRGPQGTLFGRNSVGGAVALYSKKPTEDFEGYVDATIGTDSLAKLKVSVNGALTDNLFGNFSALSATQDGYVSRPAGGDLGDDDMLAFRGSLLWEASDDVEVSLILDHSTENENGPAFEIADAGTLVDGSFAGFYNNVLQAESCGYPAGITSTDPICYNNQYATEGVNLGTAPTYSDTTSWGANLQVTWDINDNLQLKSITAYRDLDAEFARDADASPLTVVHFYDSFEASQFTQEIQLMGSTEDEKLNWITGLYYFDEEGNNRNINDFAIANFDSDNDFTTTSSAIYAQATYSFTEKLDLTVGVRYSDEEKTFDPTQVVLSSNIGLEPGFLLLPLGLNSIDVQETTPMVNLAYKATDELMVYTSYTEGFRSGGFVQRIFPALDTVPSFGPEYVESYELGFKYDSSDKPFSVNGAVFQMDYTDIQVRTQNPGFVGFFEANVGSAEISGFELESKLAFADYWFIEAAVGYTDAKFTNIDVEPPLAAVVTVDSKFDHVPEWSGNISLARDVEFENGSLVTARLSANYHTEYFNNPDNTDGIITPEVTIVDLTVLWRSPDETYGVDFGLKNLTDEKYITAGYESNVGTTEIIRDRGRQWYASFRYSFY